ncbi:CsbD family protein [Streptomyces sp. NPDC046805]|uniref:CsbD family protein n=1 Tax=Streptomyces sp. NPDC046805 TaxID=3155134 RepID=UPI0033CCA0DE
MTDQGKKIKGMAQEIKGRTEEFVGRAIGDEKMRAKGAGDRMAGKTLQAAGEAGQKVRGTAEEAKGKAEEMKGRARKNM